MNNPVSRVDFYVAVLLKDVDDTEVNQSTPGSRRLWD